MRAALPSFVFLAGLLPATASATDGLVWEWDGKERVYQIKADVRLPEVLVFKKEANSDLRVVEFMVGVTTRCSPKTTVGKRSWELVCTFDDVQLVAAATRSDAGKLQVILDEIDANLAAASMQLIVGDDGRIKNLDLEGVDKSWRRAILMHETLRLVLARAFAGLDLQLPKKGDDKGRSWTQKSILAMGFPSEFGSMGMAQVEHQVTRTDGDVVEIGSSGRGVVGAGEMVAVRPGAPERPANMYEMTYQGVATFDRGQGGLVERQYLVEGVPTASSIVSEGGQGIPYVQALRLVLIPEGETAPPLGPNEEIESKR